MGGCRCTYRNCTSKSDSKFHFFHYPVADKVRCYNWIKNAQRYDFFNLTVTQLKNRVICQSHFRDEMFMNNMKDKLKHHAVPTERGPNCTAELEYGKDYQFSFLDNLPIECEKNSLPEPYSRRTDLCLKYIDFLTNGVITELDIPNATVTVKPICDKKCEQDKESANKILFDLVDNTQENVPSEQIFGTNVSKAEIKSITRQVHFDEKYRKMNKKKKDDSLDNTQENVPSEQIFGMNVPKAEIKSNTRQVHCDEKYRRMNKKKKDVSIKRKLPKEIIEEENNTKVTEYVTFSEKLDIKQDIILKEDVSVENPQRNSNDIEITKEILFDDKFYNNEKENIQSDILPEQLIFPIDKTNTLLQLSDIGEAIQQTSTTNHYPQIYESNQILCFPQDTIVYNNDRTTESEFKIFDQALQDEFKNPNGQLDSKNLKRTIEIISEEKVSGQVPIVGGRILNVTPSFVLQPPNKDRNVTTYSSFIVNIQPQVINESGNRNEFKDVIHVDNDSKQFYVNGTVREEVPEITKVIPEEVNKVNRTTEKIVPRKICPKKVSKNIKVTPERVAVIEKKRKFNMKLRDVIEASLNRFEENESKDVLVEESEKECSHSQVVPVEFEAPKVDQHILIELVGRMKRMEDLLLYKIDQTNQKVTELKKMFEKQHKARSDFSQTNWSDDDHKNYLFQEVAQYINTELKSTLYEELFLNTRKNAKDKKRNTRQQKKMSVGKKRKVVMGES